MDRRSEIYLRGYACGRAGTTIQNPICDNRELALAWYQGYTDGKGDLEDLGPEVPKIGMETLDLSDPVVQKAFLDWVSKNGVP